MAELALAGGTPVRSREMIKWPVQGPEENARVSKVLEAGEWWYGENVRQFEAKFAEYHGAKHGITCTNGTVALILGMRALGITAGDEVIVPAYTFIASATAVTTLNAIPVFADVEENSTNIDFDSAEKLVTEHTKAIILVHFAGLPVDMDRAREFADKHNLFIVEDACHSWGSQWEGKGTGALGDFGAFSFQMSKNITAGEGGIILTDDDEIARIARSYTHVGRLEEGAWYEHHLLAGNFRMTEIQAAMLLAQLERLPAQTEKREVNGALLLEELADVPGLHFATRRPEVTRRSWHMVLFRYVASEFGGLPREKFLEALEAEGVPCSGGYLLPLYKQPAFQNLNDAPRPEDQALSNLCNERGIRYKDVHLPVVERLCTEEIVWLPHRLLLEEEEDMRDIARAIKKIHAHQAELAGAGVANG
jgi:dTDP-4-amino-4,6-dideoxygalactose transaminase